jgi:hypothetical protein
VSIHRRLQSDFLSISSSLADRHAAGDPVLHQYLMHFPYARTFCAAATADRRYC